MGLSNNKKTQPKFSTVVEEQAEGMDETAQRFKALQWTREAGTAQDYGSGVPGLILDIETANPDSIMVSENLAQR